MLCRGAERRFQLFFPLLVQLGEALRPEGGAGQSLAEDGVDRRRLVPATRAARQLWRTDLWGNGAVQTDAPVFRVRAEQRGQHHHLIFTGRDLGHGQDLVLGLRVADVQHGCRASPVLHQRARGPVSQLH